MNFLYALLMTTAGFFLLLILVSIIENWRFRRNLNELFNAGEKKLDTLHKTSQHTLFSPAQCPICGRYDFFANLVRVTEPELIRHIPNISVRIQAQADGWMYAHADCAGIERCDCENGRRIKEKHAS